MGQFGNPTQSRTGLLSKPLWGHTMLFGDDEIEIMSHAIQVPLRKPDYSDIPYKRIFHDFFSSRDFTGSKILELGPGQYDFARMLEAVGAKVVAIDSDPAVIRLGKRRGYQVIHENFIKTNWSSLAGEFDGLFCRGSINAFWYKAPNLLEQFVDNVCSVLKPEGWGWLSPYNANPPTRDPNYIEQMLRAQSEGFSHNGFKSYEPSPKIAARYNISIRENTIVFLRNIDPGSHFQE